MAETCTTKLWATILEQDAKETCGEINARGGHNKYILMEGSRPRFATQDRGIVSVIWMSALLDVNPTVLQMPVAEDDLVELGTQEKDN